jgi:hypothetical protein
MKPSRMLPGALVVGAVAVASMFAAAPASAATLPVGAKITVIDDEGEQFYNVSPSTAISTPVGTPVSLPEYISGVDVDDTGHGYALGNLEVYLDPETEEDEEWEYSAYLFKADANTGMLADRKQILIDEGGDTLVYANECSAIDYSGGVIIAVCYTYGEGDIGYVGTIDPSGEYAVLTNKTTLWEQDDTYHRFSAIALDPTDGTLYGFDNQRLTTLWTITLDDVAPVLVDGPYIDYYVPAADFDRSGQLWLVVIGAQPAALNPTFLELATFDFAAHEVVPVDFFSSEDPYEIDFPGALTVWGVLANTGSTMLIAPAIAASGVLLLGAILAAGTMVLRRRSADV